MANLLKIAFCALAFGCSGAAAADLGKRYESYLDMHQETAYGSLFFNDGAIRYKDSRTRKRFLTISGDGDVSLPSQQGYCFVFNHYGSPNAKPNVTLKYGAKIVKLLKQGTKTEEIFSGTYSPTDEPTSSILPDLCVSGIHNVSKVDIDFNSDDSAHFNWKISFAVK
jgi:hypothetical protein